MVTVALWIVWVAPYVLRNRRQQLQPAADFADDAMDEDDEEPQAGMVLKLADQQEKPMDTSHSNANTAARLIRDAGSGRNMPARSSGTFRIRYGRLAIALVGLAMIFTSAVTGVLRLFGAGSFLLPAASLLLGVLAVVTLRRLAVRDRRSKVNAAFRAAMAPTELARTGLAQTSDARITDASTPKAQGAGDGNSRAAAMDAPKNRESAIFDAEEGRSTPPPLSAFELRQAALAVAAAAGDTAVGVPKESQASLGGAWKPVDVPKPVYVDAAKAERPAPEPLDLPEGPKPVGKPTLRQSAGSDATAGVAPGLPTAAPAAAPSGSESSAGAYSAGKGQSALSNLDDVLQRRRA